MKDVNEVFRQKEHEQSRLKNEVAALRVVAPLLDDGEAENDNQPTLPHAAQMDGKPVAVQINVEVSFRFHGKENKKISKLEEKANAGDAKAELELSTDYFEGRDVPKSEVRGLELLQRAANRGLAQAQFLILT